MIDQLTTSLQESVLALLAVDDKQGQIAANLLDPTLFNDSYREFAVRTLAYRKKHNKAPGVAHLDDLVDDILANKKHRDYALIIRIISGITEAAPHLNADYVLSRINDFVQRQRIKAALTEASEIFGRGEDTTAEVRNILITAVKDQQLISDTGVRLGDKKKGLQFLDRVGLDFTLGSKILKVANFGLAYGRITLLVGPKGSGKSWACIDIGKRCVMQQHAKVVHITLENSWQETVGRYHQSLWSVPQKDETINITRMELDDLGRMKSRRTERHSPKMNLDDPHIRRYLGDKIDEWGVRLSNLIVKEFPSGTLTVPALEAYLEYLELAENFVPHILILDYPDLMKLDGSADKKRISLGNVFVDLRGLLQRRHLCGFFPTQGNRSSLDASTLKASMISEDVSKIFTSDMVMLYSQTPEEAQLGLARLAIPHNRIGRDHFSVIISQNYATGQWIIDSAKMANNYWNQVGGPRNPDEEDTEEVETAKPRRRIKR